MSEEWAKEWERRSVNGVYPLQRFLSRSNHSVVFLTECPAQNVTRAAIKIVPANPAMTEAQLARWKTVATLSHPHLIRLLDAGRCQLGGHNFLFAVMEHADQTLAQILPGRALTPDEVRDMLPATLDALAYLHDKNLVHGGLKPPNFLVVDDQLKLASDTIRAAGQRTASTSHSSLYDPPEARSGRISTAGDIWGLGITLVEALTQTPPAWSRERPERISLPTTVAAEFVEPLQRCLNRDPSHRPAIAELAAQFTRARPATLPSGAAPDMNEPADATRSTQASPALRLLVIAITAGVLALSAVWTGVRLFHPRNDVRHTASITPHLTSAVLPQAVVEAPKATIGASLPTVLHQEIPEVPHSARESIRGVIKIAVRLILDASGNVVAASLDNRASSKYFARYALDAARKWKFSHAADQAAPVWLLHFEFTRSGTTARAVALR